MTSTVWTSYCNRKLLNLFRGKIAEKSPTSQLTKNNAIYFSKILKQAMPCNRQVFKMANTSTVFITVKPAFKKTRRLIWKSFPIKLFLISA